MRHFVYTMQGSDPAPSGSGDTATWFRHYKLPATGEAFVPVKYDAYEGIIEGDMIFFCMDNVVIAKAPFLRLAEDQFNDRQELWFDADQLTRL